MLLVFDNVEDIITALRKEEVQGALIDSYVAAEYQDKLKNLRLQSIIEHVSSNGVVFLNNGLRYASCIRDFILSRQSELFELISKNVQPLKVIDKIFFIFILVSVLIREC